MRRGPKPKPTALKRLEGNPGRRPLGVGEPQVAPALVEPPLHLSEEAKAEWHRVAALLFRSGILTELDRAVMAGYCEAWGTYVEASKNVQRYGAILSSKGGVPYQSPYLNVMSTALKQLHVYAVEMGMSPSSRARVQASSVPGAGPEKKDRFFGVVGA